MVVATITLREDYWETFEIEEKDLEFIYNYLLEIETPLTPDELLVALVKDRLRREIKSIEKRRSAGGDMYVPREKYKAGQKIVIPAFNWQLGTVTGVRTGKNPDYPKFDVIQVEFEGGDHREFASGLRDHRLNDPPEIAEDDSLLNPQAILESHGDLLIERLVDHLQSNPELVYIAGRWFPRALLVDVNVGHLNLAEAALDMEGGGPLETGALLEQVELPTEVNPKLVEFSLDLALQEDQRFDEVGPAGQVLWYLKRQEPEGVLKTPRMLRYKPMEYDRSLLTEEMLDLETELDDELSPLEEGRAVSGELSVRLIYPHWKSGTLPLASRMRNLFPTAYEAPRIRLTLQAVEEGKEYSGWVVRQERYVYGLEEWYDERGLIPGSIIRLNRGEEPGVIEIRADTHRSTREWVRTVLVGADGGMVMAMLKHVVTADFDDRMAIAVSDPEGLMKIWEQAQINKTPFERVVVDIFRELAKLNPQTHVHASTLYAGVNLIRRSPPGPILALLASRSWFVHLGDFYYRLTDFEA